MTDLIKRDDAPEPCPFCKCEEVTTWFDREQGEKWGYASCDGCAARGPEVRTNWDREPDAPWHSEAIAAWNACTLPALTSNPVADSKTANPVVNDPAAIPALQARIEELTEERNITRRLLGAATRMQTETQAKLEKAVEALRYYAVEAMPWDDDDSLIARKTLAELEGK